MISGYWTKRYAAALCNSNTATFQAMTRAGKLATEWPWFNFPEPVALHDYRYLGENFRERERIKRKKSDGFVGLVVTRSSTIAANDDAGPMAL